MTNRLLRITRTLIYFRTIPGTFRTPVSADGQWVVAPPPAVRNNTPCLSVWTETFENFLRPQSPLQMFYYRASRNLFPSKYSPNRMWSIGKLCLLEYQQHNWLVKGNTECFDDKMPFEDKQSVLVDAPVRIPMLLCGVFTRQKDFTNFVQVFRSFYKQFLPANHHCNFLAKLHWKQRTKNVKAFSNWLKNQIYKRIRKRQIIDCLH